MQFVLDQNYLQLAVQIDHQQRIVDFTAKLEMISLTIRAQVYEVLGMAFLDRVLRMINLVTQNWSLNAKGKSS